MAALGTTISGVAHELNNPLATILTWSERLTERDLDAADAPRHRDDPPRGRARRAHRPQPADLRAQAPHDAHDGRHQPGGARNTRLARLRAARHQHLGDRRARVGHPAGVRRPAPDPAGAAQPRHQRRAGHAHLQRARHADGAHVAGPRSRVDRPRAERRWPGRAGGRADEDLRPVLHHQGSGQGDRARPHRRLRHRRGARRADVARRRTRAPARRSTWSCRSPAGS